MSNKSQHVQDNSVAERRLRPIYDWLDIGNNKKALQECEKVLKKTPNLHCAKALKALTLHRMGKEETAIGILNDLTEQKPTDDATLQAMTLCYRELQQLDKICRIYETAVKLDPTNEELCTHLFMSYARIFDFKSQHQAAMTLYKHKPKTPYYCWAVMSLILQATRGEGRSDTNKRNLLLKLAERMMDKMIMDGKLDAEQEVQLYVMILELQQKYEEILVILDGPLGTKLACSNPPQNKIEYLKCLKQWDDINIICKSVLENNVDRWDIWKDYIESVFELMSTNNVHENNHDNHSDEIGDTEETVDDSPEKCHEFICKIVENGADNGFSLRGPYLARFELNRKLKERNIDPSEVLGETIELFIEYFRKFGHKPCCVSDLRIYLILLDCEKRSELATKLIKDVGISSTSVPQTEQQMQRHLCALQLSRLCGAHRNLSSDHLKALVTAFALHYQHGYQTYGSNLLPTDLGPADPYGLLAGHVLYDLAVNDKNYEPIMAALVLLENLLKNSPSNFHAKLLCIKLYHTLGGALGAQNWYNSLDMKHLQLDSLGFIHCARLPTTGLFLLYGGLCEVTLKFFSSNYKDSSDHITFSYKYGSFIKLDEFMDFRERLNNSLHYTMVDVDRIMLILVELTNMDALYNLDISPKDYAIDWENLRDNHDLNVYVSWDPERIDGPPEESPEIRQFFQQNVYFLRLRTSILRALSASVNILTSTDGVRSKHVENLRNITIEWEQLIKEIELKNLPKLRQDLITLPLPSRLHGALETPQFEVLHNSFRILLECSSNGVVGESGGGGGGGSSGETIEKYLREITTNLEDFLKILEARIKNSSDLIERRITLEYVVNSVEILSVACLICLMCNDLLKPIQQQTKKSRKKIVQNSGTAAAAASVNWLINFAQLIHTNMCKLIDLSENWSNYNIISDLSKTLESLNINNIDGHQNVYENITNSYTVACRDIERVLKTKVKMLNCLVPAPSSS